MATARASYELTASGGHAITGLRVSYTEPECSGIIGEACPGEASDEPPDVPDLYKLTPSVRFGYEVVFDAVTVSAGSAYKGSGCVGLMVRCAQAPSPLSLIGRTRTNRKSLTWTTALLPGGGFSETISGLAADPAFEEQVGTIPSVFTQLDEVRVFVEVDDWTAEVMYPVELGLRVQLDGSPLWQPWPTVAGGGSDWPASGDTGTHCDKAVLDTTFSQVGFAVGYGAADAAAFLEVASGHPRVEIPTSAIPPTEWDERSDLDGKPGRVPDGLTGADIVLPELQA